MLRSFLDMYTVLSRTRVTRGLTAQKSLKSNLKIEMKVIIRELKQYAVSLNIKKNLAVPKKNGNCQNESRRNGKKTCFFVKL